LVADAAQASGTAGVLNVEMHLADEVWCDPDAMVRVLTNLLDNARKYSPEGTRIDLSVSQDQGAVRFSVRDRGPGIPAAERKAVFERFRRLEEASVKLGAGLGLYISRGLVEAHGGTLTVGDAPGGGAEFCFTIPRRSVTVPEPARIAAPVVR
jgi:signal transduction histidine kinase